MTAYQKPLAWVALTLIAALPCVVRADGKDAPKTTPTLESLQKNIDDLKAEINLLNKKQLADAGELKTRLDNIDSGLKGIKDAMRDTGRVSNYPQGERPGVSESTDGSTESRLRLLEERQRDTDKRMQQLERELSNLRSGGRLSLTQDTGTILLDNSRLNRDAVFVVNGTSYRVSALQTRSITGHQAGPFTYEVLVDGAGALMAEPISRTLQRNHIFRIFTY